MTEAPVRIFRSGAFFAWMDSGIIETDLTDPRIPLDEKHDRDRPLPLQRMRALRGGVPEPSRQPRSGWREEVRDCHPRRLLHAVRPVRRRMPFRRDHHPSSGLFPSLISCDSFPAVQAGRCYSLLQFRFLTFEHSLLHLTERAVRRDRSSRPRTVKGGYS